MKSLFTAKPRFCGFCVCGFNRAPRNLKGGGDPKNRR